MKSESLVAACNLMSLVCVDARLHMQEMQEMGGPLS